MNNNLGMLSGSGTINSKITIQWPCSFSAGTSLTTTATITINNTLTVDSGATLTASAINSNGKIFANNGIVNLSGNYTRIGGTAIWTQGINATLNIGGTFTPTGNITLNASASGNTVNYNSAAQDIQPATYVNLTLSGSGAKTFLTGTHTLNGVVSIEGTATATCTGTLSYGASSTLQYKGSSAQTTGCSFVTPFPGSGGVKIENASGVTLDAVRSVDANPFTIGSTVANSLFNDGGFQLTATGTLNLTSGTFKLGSAGTATTFPAFATQNISAGTTVEYAAGVAQTVSAETYGNLNFSGAGTRTTVGGTTTVAGNWDVTGPTADLNTNNSTYTVTGNITGTGPITMGSGTINIAGNWTNNGTFTKDSGTVIYNGSSTQTVGALTYNNLTINKGGGSALLGGVGTRVDGTLTFTAGNITTSTNDIYVSSTGSVSRTSGHVVGNLRKYISTGGTSKTFEIGDASNYTPVDISFENVSGANDLTISTASGNCSNIGSSTINASKSVDRCWTATDAGITFNNYSVIFNYVAGDKIGGADYTKFIVGKYSGSWTYPTVGTKNTTDTQATGLISFSDFQIGEPANTIPNAPVLVSPGNGTSTSDNTPTLSVNYSDPDTGDFGTTNYRISSGTAQNCLDNVNIVASGTSSPETITNNENTTWTPGSSIGSDTTYYWCAQNDDGSLTSSWTSMGNFILDATANSVPTRRSRGGGRLLPPPIVITITPVTNITTNSAAISGIVNPNGIGSISVSFLLNNSIISSCNENISSTKTLLCNLSGLSSGTTYSYKVRATKSIITTDGATQFFTTLLTPTPTPIPASTPPKVITFTRNLRLGSVGIDVRLLQQFLNKNGFLVSKTGPGSPWHETNYFGAKTKKALIKFQEAHADEILKPLGLKRGTGILGPRTRNFINKKFTQ